MRQYEESYKREEDIQNNMRQDKIRQDKTRNNWKRRQTSSYPLYVSRPFPPFSKEALVECELI